MHCGWKINDTVALKKKISKEKKNYIKPAKVLTEACTTYSYLLNNLGPQFLQAAVLQESNDRD
jgi:hypothetical protein